MSNTKSKQLGANLIKVITDNLKTLIYDTVC